MSKVQLSIRPHEDTWQEIRISDELTALYSLRDWSENFSLMTAGYRDQLDPRDATNPKVAFNSVTIAILGEARARVLEKHFPPGLVVHLHIGGETRPHTDEFIAILSRIYAAHSMTVHLRASLRTTPIWYSSFGIFYEEYQGGENLTASHSQFFKGGWKPMDAEGKQLLAEEADIISEVRNIVENRSVIRLAPWRSSGKIFHDFDVDVPYVLYQESVIGKQAIADVARAASSGFRIAVCPVGGSMKATTERLFKLLNVSVGENGTINYFLDEEDSEYHQVGKVNGQVIGPDPGNPLIYRNIGAQDLLLQEKASVVFIWDPDGDRFNIVTTAPADRAIRATELGLEVEEFPGQEQCVVYFTPNQLFFMLTAYRIGALKSAGLFDRYDWYVARSIATSRALDELAARDRIPVAVVRVGFKYLGTFAAWVESRTDVNEPFVTPTDDTVFIGRNARALIMCEESGGATFGGVDLLANKSHSRGLMALREKDGMQFGLITLSLAAALHGTSTSFADFYCKLIVENEIRHKYFRRKDQVLFDESLIGLEREKAKDAGMAQLHRTVQFFRDLAERANSGTPLVTIGSELNSRLRDECTPLPPLERLSFIGDGTLLDFQGYWCLIRASGTDAVLRYYVEGEQRKAMEELLSSVTSLRL
jgi:phosphomannomutase